MKKRLSFPLHSILLIAAIIFASAVGKKDILEQTTTITSSRIMNLSFAQSSNTLLMSDSEKKVNNAIIALNKAKQTKDNIDIATAKAQTENLSSNMVKDTISMEIALLEEEIDQENFYQMLKEDLESLQTSLNEKQLKITKQKIMELTNEKRKQELEKIVNSIEKKIEKKKAEQKKKEEEQKKREQQQLEQQRLQQVQSSYQVVADASQRNALEVIKGSISAYSPYCPGCGGYIAYGLDVRQDILYHDKTFGNIRIVAGDDSYPFGTIVRMKNVNGNDIYAIVLDRGESIGKGKLRLFDLLFATEASAYQFGIANNIECEILRYGF